jgi:cell division protein FtsX
VLIGVRLAIALSVLCAALAALGCGADAEAGPVGCVLAILATDATADQESDVRDALGDEQARNVEFVTRQEALEQFKERFPELSDYVDENPVPARFHVEAAAGPDVSRIAARLRRFAHIDAVSTYSEPCASVQPAP